MGIGADRVERGTSRVPTGFIATGPNIASQSLLFNQLSKRLRNQINGPVVTLRSGDASNLKAALKQIIREVTNLRSAEDDGTPFEQDVCDLPDMRVDSIY